LSQVIVLDTGILGMLVHPSEAGEPRECKAWLKQRVLRGASVHIPEIADYELRRELLRMKSDESVKRLDALKARLAYVPITTAAMLQAAEYWATTRGAGRPTAAEKALDGDVILAAQSAALVQPGDELVVATTNVGHLSQFVDARSWREIL
jgi:predicted nucleic acid-binding protein